MCRATRAWAVQVQVLAASCSSRLQRWPAVLAALAQPRLALGAQSAHPPVASQLMLWPKRVVVPLLPEEVTGSLESLYLRHQAVLEVGVVWCGVVWSGLASHLAFDLWKAAPYSSGHPS